MALENLLLGKHSTAIEALRGRDLTGMKALVTGGNSGIGKETVRSLALAGADVVLCSRDEEAGKRAAENVRQTGVKVWRIFTAVQNFLCCSKSRIASFSAFRE